jgi:hypothetical protein
MAANLGANQSFSSGNKPFNGIIAILEHLDLRTRIEEYVEEPAHQQFSVPTDCHADCSLAKWLQCEGGKQDLDVGLLDRLCKSCEEFQESAAQVILLVNMGKTELATAALREEALFSAASVRYQEYLGQLHILHLMQDK